MRYLEPVQFLAEFQIVFLSVEKIAQILKCWEKLEKIEKVGKPCSSSPAIPLFGPTPAMVMHIASWQPERHIGQRLGMAVRELFRH